MGLKPSPFGGAGNDEKIFRKNFFGQKISAFRPYFSESSLIGEGCGRGSFCQKRGKINFGAKVRKRSPPLRVFLRSVSLVKGAVSFRRRRGRGDRFRSGSAFGGPPPAGPSAFGVGSAAFSCSEEAPARGLFHSRGLSGCDALERRSDYEKFGLAGPAKAGPILKKKDRYVTAKTSCR